MNFLLGAIVWIGSAILRGLVLKILWGWFIVPLGVVAITIPNALGISMLITFITFTIPSKKITWEEAMTVSVGVSCAALLFGYVVQLFI